MKTQIFLALSLMTYSFAAQATTKGTRTYQCWNLTRPSAAEPDFVLTTTFNPKSPTATVVVEINGRQTTEVVEAKSLFHNTLGHSRCPGSWTEFQFVSSSSKGPFKSLSIITDQKFFGCGSAPRESVVFEMVDQTLEIQPFCTEV